MSFVKKPTATRVNSEFHLELVPNPKNVSNLTEEQKLSQTNMINKVNRASNGLFVPNPAVQHGADIKSGQLYRQGVKVSALAAAMKQHDLVMRVSLRGEHSACAMATADDLLENASISSPSGSFSLGVAGNYIRSVDFL